MLIDRFRNRLMIPIARDNGAIIAFGGRAMDEGRNAPKCPELTRDVTIYVKGRTLYGLHLSKAAITKAKHAVMVEGISTWRRHCGASPTSSPRRERP